MQYAKTMKPRIIQIDPLNVDLELIKQAAEAINNRGLVAFPTETVYGLGANALDPKAVTGIFEAKKRPLDDPLIVHISNIQDLEKLAKEIPSKARKLIDRFWPGPLTLVLKKTGLVPDLVTTGLETVAIRMPSNQIATKLIEISGVPIAAPSANMFGRPSPTKAKHVINDLEGRIDMVLDGGSTDIGVESTVVEFVDDKALVLRPGGISMEDLKTIVPEVVVVSTTDEAKEKSPGKYPQHYSPEAKVIIIEEGYDQVTDVITAASKMKDQEYDVGIMASAEHENMYPGFRKKVIGPADDGKLCATRLFDILREFDDEKVERL